MENLVRALKLSRVRRPKNEEGFVKLFISKRLIHGAATALLGIFLPIYIYQAAGEHFWVVGGFYASVFFLYATLLVPSMFITNYIGFSRSLVLAGGVSVLQMLALFLIPIGSLLAWLWLLLILMVLFRLFHWVPYHVDFTLFTKPGERGRNLSLTYATVAFMGVIGPIASGFIIEETSYNVLFGVALLLFVASTISYAYVPETNSKFTWTFERTLRKLFSKELRGPNIGAFASGAEMAVTLVAWPIFLYEILNSDFLNIGIVSTFIVAFTIAIQFFVGRHIDKAKDNSIKTLKVGSTLYAIGWLLKIFVLSVTQVFFVGLYHNIAKIFTQTPLATILYDISGDQGKYVDEYTVIREMANNTGRAASLFFIVMATFFLPINYTFILAALASVGLNLAYRIAK